MDHRDDDLDRLLAEYGRQWRRAQPVARLDEWQGPDRRRLRPRRVSLAAAAVLVVCGLAVAVAARRVQPAGPRAGIAAGPATEAGPPEDPPHPPTGSPSTADRDPNASPPGVTPRPSPPDRPRPTPGPTPRRRPAAPTPSPVPQPEGGPIVPTAPPAGRPSVASPKAPGSDLAEQRRRALLAVADQGGSADEEVGFDTAGRLQAIKAHSAGGAGSAGQRVFFFADGRLLATDSSADAPATRSELADVDDTTVAVTYELFREGDPTCCPTAGTVTVRYRQDNEAVVRLDPMPSAVGPVHR